MRQAGLTLNYQVVQASNSDDGYRQSAPAKLSPLGLFVAERSGMFMMVILGLFIVYRGYVYIDRNLNFSGDQARLYGALLVFSACPSYILTDLYFMPSIRSAFASDILSLLVQEMILAYFVALLGFPFMTFSWINSTKQNFTRMAKADSIPRPLSVDY